jgi:hypothetical protein
MIKINDEVYLAPDLIKEIKIEVSMGNRIYVLVHPRAPDARGTLYFAGTFEFKQGDRADYERARAEARVRAADLAGQITKQMQPT